MIKRIRFVKEAENTFLDAVEYIANDNPIAAQKFRDSVFTKLEGLMKFPEMFRLVPEFPELGFRDLFVGSYRFFYKPVDDTIWVAGVWHFAQIPEPPIPIDDTEF